MTDFPSNDASPLFIHTMSRFVLGTEFRVEAQAGQVASFNWVANQAIYVPFAIPWPYMVRRLFWINGSVVTTANCDVGIYSERGARIYSKGSTTQAGASVVQYVTPTTPFLLPPGRYYMAWSCDSTTNHAFGMTITAIVGKMIGMLEQATALPLPSPATFATAAGSGFPVFGITKLASGF